MSSSDSRDQSAVVHPARPLSKKYLEPIFYLAEGMAAADKHVVPKENRIIDLMAHAAGLKGFRNSKNYRGLTQQKACDQLDIEAAKRAALVIIALVLKADFNRVHSEHEYFTRIRSALNAGPIVVPVGLDAHRDLALAYLRR